MKSNNSLNSIFSYETFVFLHKSEDDIFSDIYSPFYKFQNKNKNIFINNEKNIFINNEKKIQNKKNLSLAEKISKSVFTIFYFGLSLYASTHQSFLGNSPFAATTVRPSGPQAKIAHVMPAVQEARVVMRPKMQLSVKRAAMGYMKPVTTAQHVLRKKSSSLSSLRYITTSYYIRQTYGIAVQLDYGWNDSVVFASAMVEDILLSNTHIIENCPSGVRPFDVEANMARFVKTLATDPGLNALNTSLNYQSWSESSSGEPILTFNTDATHGKYKYSSNMATIMRAHIEAFVKNYPDLSFHLAYRPSDSDHPNQKNQLLAMGISKKEGWAYHLDTVIHKLKNSIDLSHPPNNATIRDLFIANGDRTYEFLEKLYYEGKLTNSVENISQFENAIYTCVQNDINNIEALGISDLGPFHQDAVTGLRTGSTEIMRFTRMIGATPPEDLDPCLVEKHLSSVLAGARKRAACASQAKHLYSSDLLSISMQNTEVRDFMDRLQALVDKAGGAIPEISSNTTLNNQFQEIKDILSGQKPYLHILEEDSYNELIIVLRNPKRHKALFTRMAKITKSGNKYGSITD